jgi:hypothetical protein
MSLDVLSRTLVSTSSMKTVAVLVCGFASGEKKKSRK